MPFTIKAQPDSATTEPVEPVRPVSKEEPAKPEPTAKEKAAEAAQEEKVSSTLASVLGLRDPKEKKAADKAKADAAAKGKADKGAEEAKKKEADDEAKAKADEADKPKKVKVTAEPRAESFSSADVAAAASTAAAAAVRAALAEKPAALTPVVDPADGLDQDEQYDLRVYQRLEDEDPKRFKGVASTFIEGIKKARAYEADWREKNSGRDFDAEDDEHNDFYERIEPSVSERDFRSGEIKLEADSIAEKKVNERLKPLEDQQAATRRTSKVKELEPVANTETEGIVFGVIGKLAPEISEEIKKDPNSALTKLKESNPLAFDVINHTAAAALPVVSEVLKLWRSDGLVAFDSSNPSHKFIQEFSLDQQSKIKALPAQQQVHGGKRFATWDEFSGMDQAQRKLHWTLNDTHLIALLGEYYSNAAESGYKAVMEHLKKYGVETGKNIAVAAAASTKPDAAAPASPSSGAGAPIDTTSGGKKTEDEPLMKKTRALLFGH